MGLAPGVVRPADWGRHGNAASTQEQPCPPLQYSYASTLALSLPLATDSLFFFIPRRSPFRGQNRPVGLPSPTCSSRSVHPTIRTNGLTNGAVNTAVLNMLYSKACSLYIRIARSGRNVLNLRSLTATIRTHCGEYKVT